MTIISVRYDNIIGIYYNGLASLLCFSIVIFYTSKRLASEAQHYSSKNERFLEKISKEKPVDQFQLDQSKLYEKNYRQITNLNTKIVHKDISSLQKYVRRKNFSSNYYMSYLII